MDEINHCCGEYPALYEILDDPYEPSMQSIEIIECRVCDRAVYGYDEESIKEWNEGKDDGNIFIKK